MTEVATWDPAEFGNVGMEDVGATDLVIPRLSIVHDKGVFLNNLSKEEIPVLDCIILGLVKQRIMWDDVVDEGDKPQCKSPDHEHGFPQMRDDIPASKRFPWDLSNFNKDDYPAENGLNGLITLPCEACVFNKWTKDARTGKSVPPMCSEQHTYPLRYTVDGGETWTTAILTFQRTGIKPSKSYISLFSQANVPMFTSRTKLSLTVQRRGSVEFSVPNFQRGEPTDRNAWRELAETYKSIREFLRTPPRGQDDGDEAAAAPSDNTNTAPPAAAAPVTAPAPQAAPAPAPQAAPAPPAPSANITEEPPSDLPF